MAYAVKALWICAKAYSSSANLGPGFDVLALAHDAYYDIVCVRETEGFKVSKVTGGWNVPKENNNAIVVAKLASEKLGIKGVDIWVHKGVPPGRGLGSSGATAAAAVKAIELLAGRALSYEEAVSIAAEGERAVSGTPHADNVAASYLGGLVAVTYSPFKVVKFGLPKINLVVATPWIDVPPSKTGEARKVLPQLVELKDAVQLIGGTALVIKSLIESDLELLGKAVMMDNVITPRRKKLIPCYDKVLEAVLSSGAYGMTISGAGPSVLIIGNERSGEAAVRAWNECGIEASFKVVKAAPGARAHPPP